MNAPSIFEVIFWIVAFAPAVLAGIMWLVDYNFDYDPKADDPYRHCPKEEEE